MHYYITCRNDCKVPLQSAAVHCEERHLKLPQVNSWMLKISLHFSLASHRECNSQNYWIYLFTPLLWVNSHRPLWYGRDEISLTALSLSFQCHQSDWLSKCIQTTSVACSLIPLECKLPQTRGLSFLTLQLESKHMAQTRQTCCHFWINATVFFDSF